MYLTLADDIVLEISISQLPKNAATDAQPGPADLDPPLCPPGQHHPQHHQHHQPLHLTRAALPVPQWIAIPPVTFIKVENSKICCVLEKSQWCLLEAC